MSVFEAIALLLTFAAVGGYLNHRYVKLPITIGYMAFALLLSLCVIGLNALGWFEAEALTDFVKKVDLPEVLLHGMLSVLLFAGALHINWQELKQARWTVLILATGGVVLATLTTGTLVWYAAHFLGFDLPYIYALLFGALISPTDPIAVLAILKEVGVSKKLYTKIGGESLFNDGVGVVVFMAVLGAATSAGGEQDWGHLGSVFLKEALGGLVLGGVLGWLTYLLMRSIDEYKVEVMLTLALVTGGYALAEHLHISAPICMVAAGLIIGNQGRSFGMSDETQRYIDNFWELLDEICNAVLFLLIGLALLIIPFSAGTLALGACAILAMLAGRLLSVGLPISLLRFREHFKKGTIALMTWGGLRGGISIALALSLPHGPFKELILPMTYIVVLFSILVQGLTFKSLARRWS